PPYAPTALPTVGPMGVPTALPTVGPMGVPTALPTVGSMGYLAVRCAVEQDNFAGPARGGPAQGGEGALVITHTYLSGEACFYLLHNWFLLEILKHLCSNFRRACNACENVQRVRGPLFQHSVYGWWPR
ncbi:hypothetical protein T484DRAFT_1621775, partial [Baffinella frigidus]